MTHGLDDYNRKRNFDVTAEPKGRKARSAGDSFVVQKHAARRLHYDFRLELDGVLKSWAVAKGPSLVPGEKRLAVHVEDHPLDYGGFEGTIPKGEYGGGAVMLWDRGNWRPDGDPRKGYAKGHLDFTLEGEKLKGRWHLVKMRSREGERNENWLLIKSQDESAREPDEPDILDEQPRSVVSGRSIEQIAGDKKSREWRSNRAAPARAPSATGAKTPRQRAAEAPPEPEAAPSKSKAKAAAQPHVRAKPARYKIPAGAGKARMPDFIDPALATLSVAPPQGAWLHEIKFDGYRLQGRREKSRVWLRTRKGLDWTDRFPALARALADLPVGEALFDGEAVVENESGVSDFAALQSALKEGRAEKIVYYVFDLLYLDGHDLRRVPLLERKRLLAQIVGGAPSASAVRFSEHFEEHGEAMLRHVCRMSGEGIVSKKRAGSYTSGRTQDWLKSKCAHRQEFVVVGFVPSTAASKAIGSLVLAYWKDGRLVHAGRVGTGFSSGLATELFAELAREQVDHPLLAGPLSADVRRNVKWVRPIKVAEVEFRGWTGGEQLRQASFKGMREDKDPSEIVREEPAGPEPSRAPQVSARTKVELTHSDRVLWPEAGVTKQGLADYYAAVWPFMERFVVDRPLALVRCPTGIARGCFFQKHAWEGMGNRVRRIHDPHDKEPILAIEDLDGLLTLVQASVLEIHPWGARAGDLDRPDMLTIDLDPGDGVTWPQLVRAANEARERLRKCGLESFVKTSGGKGLHVVVPLQPKADWDTAKAFCKELADVMARDDPDRYVATMAKKARANRIYVDYLRNGRGATAVAAYSTRARLACGVSTPLSWEELEGVASASHFTLGNVMKRLSNIDRDPWADFFSIDQSLPRESAKKKSARRS